MQSTRNPQSLLTTFVTDNSRNINPIVVVVPGFTYTQNRSIQLLQCVQRSIP